MDSNTLHVFIFSEKGLDKRHAEETAKWFDKYPGPVTVKVVGKSVDLQVTDEQALTWDTIFTTLERLRDDHGIPEECYCYLLTKSPNELNWFAAEDRDNPRNAFGHLADFSWVTTAPASVVASHYILKTVFNSLLIEAGIALEKFWHEETRGCFFDFCQNKTDLSFKLRTADICGDCMEVFQSIGLPSELLQQTIAIMEASRRLALNTGPYLVKETLFDRWPYPIAITRHKAVQSTNPLYRFLLLLDHFDSVIRYFFIVREIMADRSPNIVDRPSLGWWVDQLALSLKGEKNFRDVISIAQNENVVKLRNERRGHGWMAPFVEDYQADAQHLEETLSRIEQELEPFLLTHQLILPRQISLHDAKYVVEGERLSGSHVLHPPVTIQLEKDPLSYGLTSQDKIFLSDNNYNFFKLMAPYLVATICPTCKHHQILLADGGRQYIDVFMGHRAEL